MPCAGRSRIITSRCAQQAEVRRQHGRAGLRACRPRAPMPPSTSIGSSPAPTGTPQEVAPFRRTAQASTALLGSPVSAQQHQATSSSQFLMPADSDGRRRCVKAAISRSFAASGADIRRRRGRWCRARDGRPASTKSSAARSAPGRRDNRKALGQQVAPRPAGASLYRRPSATE